MTAKELYCIFTEVFKSEDLKPATYTPIHAESSYIAPNFDSSVVIKCYALPPKGCRKLLSSLARNDRYMRSM